MTGSTTEQMHSRVVRIKRIDKAKRVVLGEAYASMVMDTYCEFMLPDDVEAMCHRFAQLPLSETIDTNHDNAPTSCFPVESFITREGDRDFLPGSWVVGVKVADDHIWAQVLKGELNGFSFEAMVRPVDVVAKVETIRDHVGETEPAGVNDHRHLFFVTLNDFGRVVSGQTSVNENHQHPIRMATRTERVNNHVHRFFI